MSEKINNEDILLSMRTVSMSPSTATALPASAISLTRLCPTIGSFQSCPWTTPSR